MTIWTFAVMKRMSHEGLMIIICYDNLGKSRENSNAAVPLLTTQASDKLNPD